LLTFVTEMKLQIEYSNISLFMHVLNLVSAKPDLINKSIFITPKGSTNIPDDFFRSKNDMGSVFTIVEVPTGYSDQATRSRPRS